MMTRSSPRSHISASLARVAGDGRTSTPWRVWFLSSGGGPRKAPHGKHLGLAEALDDERAHGRYARGSDRGGSKAYFRRTVTRSFRWTSGFVPSSNATDRWPSVSGRMSWLKLP